MLVRVRARVRVRVRVHVSIPYAPSVLVGPKTNHVVPPAPTFTTGKCVHRQETETPFPQAAKKAEEKGRSRNERDKTD